MRHPRSRNIGPEVAQGRSPRDAREGQPTFGQDSAGTSLLDELDLFRRRASRRHHDDERRLSIPELRALAELKSDLQWDDLQRRREAHDIAVATAIGWVGVARRILFVGAGFAAIALGITGQLDVLELLRSLR